MILETAAPREGFKNKAVLDTGFIQSSDSIADELARTMHQRICSTLFATASLKQNLNNRY